LSKAQRQRPFWAQVEYQLISLYLVVDCNKYFYDDGVQTRAILNLE